MDRRREPGSHDRADSHDQPIGQPRSRTGRDPKTTVYWTHAPTTLGRCHAWWPSFAGGLLTLLALALAATRGGRRLVAEFPVPRMTTRRWTIAVAVIGIEAGLTIGVMRSLGADPRASRWPPILLCLAIPPTLVFLPAFGRTRSAGDASA